MQQRRRSRTRCEQAILDSPMFQARWRWNLNRSLLVLRFRGGRTQPAADPAHGVRRPHGRGVPAGRRVPGERHRPDRDPRPRARAPDHRRHAARGARRRRRCARCSSAIEAGDGARCTASTPPSRRCSRTRSSPRGRTRSSTTRSSRTGAPTRCTLRRGLSRRPRVDRRARRRRRSSRCTTRSRPSPRRADDLHDLLCSLVIVARPRPEWRALCDELVDARPRSRARAATARELWCATERLDDARHALRRRRRRRDRGGRCAATSSSPASPRSTTLARGDRRSTAGRVASPASRCSSTRASRCRAATPRRRADTEWVARRLLARMHSYSRRSPARAASSPRPPRTSCASCCAGSTSRPAPSSRGDAGLATRRRAAAGLRGRRGGVGARAARAPAARLRPRAGSTGCATTARSAGCGSHPRPRDVDAPAGAPSKATPISVVFRDDLPWLLEAARAGGDPAEPTVGAHRRDRSRCSARAARASPAELGDRHQPAARRHRARAVGRRRPRAAHLRRLRRDPRARRPAARAPARRRRGSRGCCAGHAHAAAGRRALVARAARPSADIDRDELAEAVAELLLHRWGVVFRDLARARLDPVPVARRPAGAAPARRPRARARRPVRHRLQRRAVRAARPRSSSSRTSASSPRTGERVTVNATDPLQPRRRRSCPAPRPRGPHQPGHLRRRRARRLTPEWTARAASNQTATSGSTLHHPGRPINRPRFQVSPSWRVGTA